MQVFIGVHFFLYHYDVRFDFVLIVIAASINDY